MTLWGLLDCLGEDVLHDNACSYSLSVSKGSGCNYEGSDLMYAKLYPAGTCIQTSASTSTNYVCGKKNMTIFYFV